MKSSNFQYNRLYVIEPVTEFYKAGIITEALWQFENRGFLAVLDFATII